jgi:ATP-dependent Clp protease ATP-binding subunit ClpA
MIAQELEVCLHMAFVEARQQRHEYITVEHLLLALLSSPTASNVLRACGANLDELRKNLTQHIAEQTPCVAADREVDTQPTLGFQRAIQRAILQVQSSGNKEVTGAEVLVAIFGEKGSHAVYFLQKQGVARLDVINYTSHGITKTPEANSGTSESAEKAENVARRSDSADGRAADNDLSSTFAATSESSAAPLAQELELSLHKAFVEAQQSRHEFVTVEHLLLALLHNATAAEVLRACGANMDELGKNLAQHVAEQTPLIAAGREVNSQPTLGFQRVIQRAIVHVQSAGKKEVTGANVLVAIFGEKDSHAVYFLQQQGIVRLDVVKHLSHGATKMPQPDPGTSEATEASDVQVVIYNDDYTPMEFLVRVLQKFFGMKREDAAETMLEIYRDGAAVCGLYSRDAGEALVRQIVAYALENGHPLRCVTAIPK